MTRQDVFVSVVAPLSNDADVVEAFVDETAEMLSRHFSHGEIVLVDDGSTDGTAGRVDAAMRRHSECRLIVLSRRFGTEVSIAAGLESAIGDFVVVMDPDTDPPSLVPEMVNRCRLGAGVVTGVRASRMGEPLFLRAGARFFYHAANGWLGLGLVPDATHFKVLSRQVVNAIVQIRDRNRYLRTLSINVGYATVPVTYEPIARRPHPRRKGPGEAVMLAINITLTNSVRPLRLAALLGVLMAGCSAILLAWVAVSHIFGYGVPVQWVGGSAATTAMLGSLGLITSVGLAYLARLVEDSSDRPLYFVREERTSADAHLAVESRNVVSESAGPQ